MQSDAREVLSALIDREPVDPEVLASLLETPEARAMLVDFVRVRTVVLADEAGQSVVPLRMAPRPRLLDQRRAWMGLAAGLLLFASLGGGFWVGERLGRDAPPAPTRVVQFQAGVDWR